MSPMFDVTVLFGSTQHALNAMQLVGAPAVYDAELAGLGSLHVEPRAYSGQCDWRLVARGGPAPDRFDVGTASLQVKLEPADPNQSTWEASGRMRRASLSLKRLVEGSALGIILHGAGNLFKPSSLVVEQLGEVEQQEVCPYAAWLDFVVDDQLCYSRGLFAYFGALDYEAEHGRDDWTRKRALQAVQFACAMEATGQQLDFHSHLDVPLWHRVSCFPPHDERLSSDHYVRWILGPCSVQGLRSLIAEELRKAHPIGLWDKHIRYGDEMPLGPYASLVCDRVLHKNSLLGMGLKDHLLYRATAPAPQAWVCEGVVGEGTVMAFTAGFARRSAPNGRAEDRSLRVEYATWCHRADARLHRLLLHVGHLGFGTSFIGDMGDWDWVPGPEGGGWGLLLVPHDELVFSVGDSVVLRLVVPVRATQLQQANTRSDREAWFRLQVKGMQGIMKLVEEWLHERDSAPVFL